mmetsp:Transcript_15196/g.26350  ORF Transcript_15196/g.26350 Transcript_15196/m.26350 type:complete len:98 (-) Transcript_15196:64-357(-)
MSVKKLVPMLVQLSITCPVLSRHHARQGYAVQILTILRTSVIELRVANPKKVGQREKRKSLNETKSNQCKQHAPRPSNGSSQTLINKSLHGHKNNEQ